ncbi:FG-GAP-like repeat-containing protein [Hymenobacter sp. GOD-10R]|uniref:FG-GAP-like repeat-containing protein n=1 Tax=Hymenobacter sp. GOD-10R TaxID=3093922 RepID=UPI002D7A274C|nr:FG-GAP-like repeat-containing protein [Hymenobacter sp. GOD-10R]WRQ30846.1 FG-GAP-like repeat-containing protein [Hymenobacter sp. GOD-10R]
MYCSQQVVRQFDILFSSMQMITLARASLVLAKTNATIGCRLAVIGVLLAYAPAVAQTPTPTPSSGFFSGGGEVSTGRSSQSIALGDVDKDGDLDLATADYGGNTVSIRLNAGGGNFLAGPTLSGADMPTGIILADLDGDGDLDFATSNNTPVGITVGLNQGNTTFTTRVNPVNNAHTYSIAAGDLDKDGDIDLVVGGVESLTAYVLRNNGQGSFTRSATVALNTPSSNGNEVVSLGDVDGDGDLDLLAVSSGSTVSISFNIGAGTFVTSAQGVPLTGSLSSVTLGDVDGDGDQDLLAANGNSTSGNLVSVRLNNGAGRFSDGQDVVVGSMPTRVAVGDVDGDGDLDFVSANSSSNTATVCLNNGSGGFFYANKQQVSVGSVPLDVALGDLDGDGDLDLATANDGTASVRLNQNQALPRPTITSLSATTSAVGSSLTITGIDFLNVKEVSFNGVVVPAAELVPNSLTQLTVAVPVGATTGAVVVTTAAGASNGVLLTISPSTQVTAVLPTRNAPAAVRNTPVAITFDQPLSTAGTTLGSLKVFSEQEGKKAGNTTVNGNTLTFTPATPFQPGILVQATVSNSAQSTTGSVVRPHVFQFTTATSPASGVFGGGTDVSVTGSVQDILAGDVDGDGDIDMVAANNTTPATMSVRLNNGTGGFTAGQEVSVASAYRGTLGDVDGDGDLDLLSGSIRGTVSVRLNNGNGTFSNTGQAVAINGYGSIVALGDVDADGDLDLLSDDGVHFNDGTGTFSGLSNSTGNLGDVTLGDVDNDGDLDIVSTKGAQVSTVTVQLNNGVGGFTTSQVLDPGMSGAFQSVLGDVDKDGDLDIITAASYSNTLKLRLNNGNGTFGNSQEVAVGNNPVEIKLSDLDGDGDLDLLVANSNRAVSVRINNGAGGFSTGQDVSFTAPLSSLAVGDVNGDGAPDLLAGNTTAFLQAGRVSVRLNQPTTLPLTVTALTPVRNGVAVPLTGPLSLSFSQLLSNSASTQNALKVFSAQRGGKKASTATVTGNTLSITPSAPFKPGETVFATLTTGVQNSSGQNLAAGQVYQFTAATSQAPGYFYGTTDVAAGASTAGVVVAGVVPGDVDGDGDLDLVSTTGVQLNNGAGRFVAGATLSIAGTARALTLGDVDADGDLDVVVATNTGVGIVEVRLNNGQGNFSGTQRVSVGSDPSAIALADVDADGDLDLLTANYSSNTVSVRLNNGTGLFSGNSEVTVGAQPVSLALGDVDNDGDLDLLTPSFSGTTVSVRLNSGTGTFSGNQEVAVGFNPHSVSIADLDGDGDLDLVTANYNNYGPTMTSAYSSSVGVRLNDGAGSFSGTRNLPVRRGAVSVVLADVEGEGYADIIVASENDYDTDSGTVSVVLNISRTNSFYTRQELVVGRGVGSVAAGDLDGDGDLDIISGNGADGTASVRINRLPSEGGAAVLRTATSASPSALSLYPNPSTGRFTLSYMATQTQAATLTLTDRLGRVVQQQRLTLQVGENTVLLEAPASAAGFYQLTLRTTDGRAHQQKLAIQP